MSESPPRRLLFVHSAIDDAGLSAPAFRVLAHLVRRADKDGWARPGVRSIARVCKIDDTTVQRAIRELELAGLVFVDRGRGRGCQHRYRVLHGIEAASQTVRKDGTLEGSETVPSFRTGVPQNRTVPEANCPVVSAQVCDSTGQKDIQEGHPITEKDISMGDPVQYPAELDTSDFRAAWSKWLTHLSQKGVKPTRSSFDALWEQFLTVGVKCAIAMITTSIANNWHSINVPKLLKTLGSGKTRGTYEDVFPDPDRRRGMYDGAF